MSVLKFPRIYFSGVISWDPGLENNNSDVYDAANSQLKLPPGVTFDTFKEWVIENDTRNWNYYGTHTCRFLTDRTTITGGVLDPVAGLITSDPVIGKPVKLQGKLVDLDPVAVWNSQIYFDDISIGDDKTGIIAKRHHRMHSRWINFSRNLGGLPIAGGASVVWQTVFPLKNLTIDNAANSPLIEALTQTSNQPDSSGLMMRFSTYRTLYFQNGILNDIPQQPRSSEELREMYQAGHIFSNPAYSLVTGVIGIWNSGELASVPQGRLLVPAERVQGNNMPDGRSFALGPCVAVVNPDLKLISLDFNSTIPEIDAEAIKANVGPLTLSVKVETDVIQIAVIEPVRYDREAYEAQAGIIDISLLDHSDPNLFEKIEIGQLIITNDQLGQPVRALREAELSVQADDRDVYLDEAVPQEVILCASYKGKPAHSGTRILIAKYDSNGRLIPASTHSPEILSVSSDGLARLNLIPSAPGFLNIGFFPFNQNEPIPQPTATLDIMSAFFICLRTLPFDNLLEAQTTDNEINWQFIYENILRVYDLLNPIMSSPEIALPLNSQAIWTNPMMARRLKEVTAQSNVENFTYMPATRALSAGKRKLLHRWCDLVISGQFHEGDILETEVEIMTFPFSKRL